MRLTKEEFINAYKGISLSYTLINMANEYLKRHYRDIEDIGEILKVLNCTKEKLGKAYIIFINKNIIPTQMDCHGLKG